MKKAIYLNNGYILGVVGGFLISYLLILFINSIIHSPEWVIIGTFFWLLTISTIILTKLMPPIMIIDENKTVEFFGIPWHYKFNRKCLDTVIIGSAGLTFEVKPECAEKMISVPKYKEGRDVGKRVILFVNIKGIGALIEALAPIDGTYGWENISAEKREYLQKKLYETEKGR